MEQEHDQRMMKKTLLFDLQKQHRKKQWGLERRFSMLYPCFH